MAPVEAWQRRADYWIEFHQEQDDDYEQGLEEYWGEFEAARTSSITDEEEVWREVIKLRDDFIRWFENRYKKMFPQVGGLRPFDHREKSTALATRVCKFIDERVRWLGIKKKLPKAATVARWASTFYKILKVELSPGQVFTTEVRFEIEKQVNKICELRGLDQYITPRPNYGKAELLLLIEYALLPGQHEHHPEHVLQNVLAWQLMFLTGGRPGSLCWSKDADKAKARYMKVGDLQFVRSKPNDPRAITLLVSLKYLKADGPASATKFPLDFVLMPPGRSQNIIFDPALTAFALFLSRGYFKHMRTAEDLFAASTAAIEGLLAYGREIGLVGTSYSFRHDSAEELGSVFGSRTAAIVLNHAHAAGNVSERHYLRTISNLPISAVRYGENLRANSLIAQSNARFRRYAGLAVSAVVRMAAKRARDDTADTKSARKKRKNPKLAEVDRQADEHVQHLVENMKEIVDQLNQLVPVKCKVRGYKGIRPAVTHAQDLRRKGNDQIASKIEGLVLEFEGVKTKKEKQRREERRRLKVRYEREERQEILGNVEGDVVERVEALRSLESSKRAAETIEKLTSAPKKFKIDERLDKELERSTAMFAPEIAVQQEARAGRSTHSSMSAPQVASTSSAAPSTSPTAPSTSPTAPATSPTAPAQRAGDEVVDDGLFDGEPQPLYDDRDEAEAWGASLDDVVQGRLALLSAYIGKLRSTGLLREVEAFASTHAMCYFCGAPLEPSIAASTSNLRRHLRRHEEWAAAQIGVRSEPFTVATLEESLLRSASSGQGLLANSPMSGRDFEQAMAACRSRPLTTAWL
ncbi:uncharacterized protein PSFLO_06670 [Pseudozyma flocculosa]|uniref:Uncharacterized protein n=1 Tax=Pseudozyma flocculosa TaxID=84751 RepID=A0A5C3F9R5_9BASI|nr:uncharacterized protein PSFLO_06670 [Pseudozyma flocculosa]